ncbi:hypothetical protein MLD38_006608 [Melastoma candidum]|uniref:Uncharacterized protein n=1 Tax=Melastoma candidum TaxID=119954 RepID=A0ACB9RN33_9MYRT|nr:hypothetical protein MLD38_006608 [Melastoma candidum]
MDRRFKLRISRIFHNSCKSRDDVANSYHDVLDKSPLLSPSVPAPARPLPRPSICNPRTPPSLHVNSSCIISSKDACRRTRTRTRTKERQPVARFTHFAYNPFYDRKDNGRKKKRKEKKKGEVKAMLISHDRNSYSSDDEREGEDEDEDDGRTVETLFSSRRSLSSSESSENRRRMIRRRERRRRGGEVAGGVKGSMAVVKKTMDPEGDFRRSMVEMIMERQIFGEEELHRLLLCFLSLNSTHHHNIIIHVFKEIWDALFCM